MEIAAVLIAGFGGAIIGAVTVFFVEVWKQVLEFRVACLVVRYEMFHNMGAVDGAKSHPAMGPKIVLREDAWDDCRFKLASVMSEGNWNPIATSYAGLPATRSLLSRLSNPITANDHQKLEDASKELFSHVGSLATFEAQSRVTLFWIVMRGRIDDYP